MIRIGLEIQCLLYAGFFLPFINIRQFSKFPFFPPVRLGDGRCARSFSTSTLFIHVTPFICCELFCKFPFSPPVLEPAVLVAATPALL